MPRRRDDAGQTAQEGDRVEDEVGAAIGPGPFEAIGHLPLFGEGQALAGKGRPRAMAAQAFQPEASC
jgi:hypothetical protein